MPQPDIQGFTNAMKKAGYSDAYINNYIARKTGHDNNQPQQQSNPLQDIAKWASESSVIPAIGSGLGAFTGGVAGSVVPGAGNIVGAGTGAALGTAGAKILQNVLKDFLGTQNKSNMEQIGDVSKESLIQGAVGAGSEFAAPYLAKIASPITKPVGKWLFKSGINEPASVVEKELLTKTSGKPEFNYVEKMIQDGYKGGGVSITQQAKSNAKSVWDSLTSLAKQADANGSSKVFDLKKDIVEPFANVVKDMSPDDAPIYGKAFQKLVDNATKKYGSNKLTLEELINFNKSLNKTLISKAGTQSTSQAASAQAKATMKEAILNFLQDNNPEMSALLKEYGLTKDIQKIGSATYRSQQNLSKPPSNILQLVNLPFKALRNPELTTRLGKGVYNSPKAINRYLPWLTTSGSELLNGQQ